MTDERNPSGRCFSVIRVCLDVHIQGLGLYCTIHYAVLTGGIVIGMLRSMTPCLWLFTLYPANVDFWASC